MDITWVQDRTGRNVIHRAGCSHIRLNAEAETFTAASLDQALVRVAADNIDPTIDEVAEASEWVSISACLQ